MRMKSWTVFFIFTFLVMPIFGCSAEENKDDSSRTLSKLAWTEYGNKNYDKVIEYTSECIKKYSQKAQEQQASLKKFAAIGQEEMYMVLNDVGSCYFVLGETYRKLKQNDKAIEAFQTIIDKYGFSQYWSEHGWYWKLAPAAKETIDKLTGAYKQSTESTSPISQDNEPLVLAFPGTEEIVDYPKYGEFENVGTDKYRYVISDMKGLLDATGEGIYPNTSIVYKDPEFLKLTKEGLLKESQWNYINSGSGRKDFYRWAAAGEAKGVKQYYTSMALEEAGLIKEAIKGYYSVIIHMPQEVGWTFWHTPWYIAEACIDSIYYLTEKYPELGIKISPETRVKIVNGFNEISQDDKVITNPGKLMKVDPKDVLRKEVDLSKIQIVKQQGEGRVKLIKYANGHWQLMVDGKPFVIKGVTYTPTPIGQSPDDKTFENWMFADENKNGKVDGPYDVWVDKNRNNKQDPDEIAVGDFQLMKEMGVNVVRIYHQPHEINKQLLRELYENYGIMTIMGDFVGAYTIGSGATWEKGTDYSDETQIKNMLKSVEKMVMEFKDEPYILMWLLGNENNYGVANNAKKDPTHYYEFLDKAAQLIKQIDKNQRPVAACNGDLLFLDIFSAQANNVDVLGINAYRGKHGFGYNFWQNVQDNTDRPVFLTEYGCPAYSERMSIQDSEAEQAKYLKGAWEDIEINMAGKRGVGNALGGIVFEWVDEWWKSYEAFEHDSKKNWAGPFPDGWMYEEWLGLTSQGNGEDSPYSRVLRDSYFTYKKMWNN